MFLQLPTRWIAVLLLLSAFITFNACSKEYSFEHNNPSFIDGLLPEDSTNNNDDTTGNGPVNGDTTNTGGNNDTSTTTVTDVEFLKKATIINRAQINNAKLAVERGNLQSVSDFGQAVMTRFTDAQGDIDDLGAILEVAIPPATDAAHQAVTTSFLDMEGRTFDAGYTDYQLSELQRAIDLYLAQINNGTDNRVKAYARKYLPYLQEFLQTASSIRQNL